jgi:hypothetical protein
MSELVLTLTVECAHSNKRRLQVQTEPSDETCETIAWFRLCDGCAALAERAGFDFVHLPDLTEDEIKGRAIGGTDD